MGVWLPEFLPKNIVNKILNEYELQLPALALARSLWSSKTDIDRLFEVEAGDEEVTDRKLLSNKGREFWRVKGIIKGLASLEDKCCMVLC